MSRVVLILFGLLVAETAMAQNTMGPIIGNQGIITQGQQGNNTIIQGPVRAKFTDQLGQEILQKIPKDRPTHLTVIGGDADQAVGNQIQQYMIQNGYTVQRSIVGMMSPPPSRPFVINVTNSGTAFTVAPSAH